MADDSTPRGFWDEVSTVQQGPYPQFQQPVSTGSSRRWGSAAMVAVILGSGLVLRAPLSTMAETFMPWAVRPSAAAPSVGSQNTNPTTLPSLPTQPEQQEQSGTSQQDDPWAQQGTNEQSGSSGQTTVSAAQQKGVALISTRTANGAGAGTGMVLSADGYVLTNYHVVQSSTSVQVTIATNRETFTANLVGHDASRDVALLKLEGASGLDTVTLDDDHDLAVGTRVTAVGNSEGQGYLSAATGTVTDLTSSITVTDENSAQGSEELSDVVQTTAAAVPGDSGGPLLDVEGEVVGMTTAGQQQRTGRTSTVTVASYAVPITRAIEVVDQIRAGQEQGTVKVGPKAYLGVSVQTDQSTGQLVVAHVVAGQPAARAGLTEGDQITAIDGTDIRTHAELASVLAERDPGDVVTIDWTTSDGQQRSSQATLGASPVN